MASTTQPAEDMRREDKEYVDVLRSLVRQENDLTNHRTTWLLVTQGILFATASAPTNEALAPTIIIGIFGVLAAASFGYVLENSAKSRKHLKDLWKKRVELRGYGPDDFAPLDGGYTGVNPCPRLQPWYFVPRLIVVAWVAYVLYRAWPK